MKRTVIFATFLLAGMLMFLSILAMAASPMFMDHGWSSDISRVWYYAFNEQCVGLGFFVILGIIMFLFGLIGLLRELPKKDDGSAKNAHEVKLENIKGNPN